MPGRQQIETTYSVWFFLQPSLHGKVRDSSVASKVLGISHGPGSLGMTVYVGSAFSHGTPGTGARDDGMRCAQEWRRRGNLPLTLRRFWSNEWFYVNIYWAGAPPRTGREFIRMPQGQLEEGSLLNERYRIIRVIGQGGMGTVYQAEHERLNAILAIKEIRAVTGTAQQTTVEQYEQEARFLVRLNHPNLPKVTDAFVDNDRFYLVMDFVEGVTLDTRLRERGGKPLEPEVVVEWAIQIANVLGYLHSQDPPIIFRDLKPSNVMVQSDGHVKLIDFGIARRFQPGATQDTALLGSVGYSPPEQFGRHQTDTRSDIYALGATLHNLLTARDPSTTPFKFVPVDQVVLGVPVSFSRLIAQCLAIEPELRPPDTKSVSAELVAIREDLQRVGLPAPGASTDAGSRIISSKLKEADRVRPKQPAAMELNLPGSRQRKSHADRPLRAAVLSIATFLIVGGASFAVITANSHSHNKNKPNVNMGARSGTADSQPAGAGADLSPNGSSSTLPTTVESSGPSAAAHPVEPPQSAQDGNTAPNSAKTAECKAEVVGLSPDGKSIRIHVTGVISGKADTAGMVAAYFYNADKTPLLAIDTKGPYASPTGQLFAEFTFQIDADSKPIDGTVDVPLDQFTSKTGLLFRCIVYADNQSAGQTELLPLASDSTGASSSRQSGVHNGVGNRTDGT